MERLIEKAKRLNKKVIAIGVAIVVAGAGALYIKNNTIPDPNKITTASGMDKYYDKLIKSNKDKILELAKEEIVDWELDSNAKYHFCKDKDITITRDNQYIVVKGIVYMNDITPKEFKVTMDYYYTIGEFFIVDANVMGE